MSRKSIGNIIVTAKAFMAGEIFDNHLNPIHLKIATTVYGIQLQLPVPDRLGFFSPGPPRLQVREAASFVGLIIVTCFLILYGGFVLFLLRLLGVPNTLQLGAAMLLMIVAQVVLVWALTCFSRHRTPEYEWADWKLRKD
jgi:hypothetical protein